MVKDSKANTRVTFFSDVAKDVSRSTKALNTKENKEIIKQTSPAAKEGQAAANQALIASAKGGVLGIGQLGKDGGKDGAPNPALELIKNPFVIGALAAAALYVGIKVL